MEPGVMCYANRQGSTYHFSEVPAPSYWAYRFRQDAVWSAAESKTVGTLLRRFRWWDMRLCNDSSDRVVRAASKVDRVYQYCASDRSLVYVKNPREGARLWLRLPERMSGAFVDVATNQGLEIVAYDDEPGWMWELAVPAPHSSVVLMLMQTK